MPSPFDNFDIDESMEDNNQDADESCTTNEKENNEYGTEVDEDEEGK